MEMLTTKDIADRMHVTVRVATYWCSEGFLKSAKKLGRDWVIDGKELVGFQPPKPGPKTGTKNKRKKAAE